MQLEELIAQYQDIHQFLNQNWPLASRMKRTFARTMKVVEELGELANEILTSMNLQRQAKIAQFSHENLEDEYADVFGALILLGIELDLDIEKIIQRKIKFTKKRFGLSEKTAH